MKIKNYSELAKSPLRHIALDIVEEGLQAIDTERVIRNAVQMDEEALTIAGERIPFADLDTILVAGVGKCAARAAGELERILGDRLTAGFVIAIGDVPPLERTVVHVGTHPYPSATNIIAARELLGFVTGLTERDLVIFLTTGGGSTLLCLPPDEDWEREGKIFAALTKAGAPITELNTVRKHHSRMRGGFLAEAMRPARVAALIFNDVPGSEDIGFIASGPTVKDTTTVADAERILEKYKVFETAAIEKVPLLETPKDDAIFARVRNTVVVSNRTALEAMAEAARRNGFAAEIRDLKLSGEAREMGWHMVEGIAPARAKTAHLYGGETTVTLRAAGKGGRNQEATLGALRVMPKNVVFVAAASDGRDNTEFGGAMCDTITKERARELGEDLQTHLDANRSYDFFARVGDHLTLGDTGSNVADLFLVIKN